MRGLPASIYPLSVPPASMPLSSNTPGPAPAPALGPPVQLLHTLHMSLLYAPTPPRHLVHASLCTDSCLCPCRYALKEGCNCCMFLQKALLRVCMCGTFELMVTRNISEVRMGKSHIAAIGWFCFSCCCYCWWEALGCCCSCREVFCCCCYCCSCCNHLSICCSEVVVL